MPRVESIPTVAQIDLEPGTEIHRFGSGWNTDVAKITGTVSGWDIHAATKCDRQMGEVATNAPLFRVCLPSRSCRVCVSIPELNMVIHIIADCLNQRPSLGDVAELRPGERHKKVRLAVT